MKQNICEGIALCISQRAVPPFATSIDAAIRCRFRRMLRLTRSTPCGLKAAPAAGRPVVSLPLHEGYMSRTKTGGLLASLPVKESIAMKLRETIAFPDSVPFWTD
ncbi:MAG: hypothetical protein MR400_07515 [Clostridiales bacterium]|nr:hypothetical protein [Clostridiales bacterium]